MYMDNPSKLPKIIPTNSNNAPQRQPNQTPNRRGRQPKPTVKPPNQAAQAGRPLEME